MDSVDSKQKVSGAKKNPDLMLTQMMVSIPDSYWINICLKVNRLSVYYDG